MMEPTKRSDNGRWSLGKMTVLAYAGWEGWERSWGRPGGSARERDL